MGSPHKHAWQMVEQNYAASTMVSDQARESWVPWEEVCRLKAHQMMDDHKGYRCASCHFDTSEAWTWECPNPMCALESMAVAQGWITPEGG